MLGKLLFGSVVVAISACDVDGDVDYVPNEIPTISVSSPIPGTVFLESEPVPVTVTVADADEADLSVMQLEWIMVPAPEGEGPANAGVTGTATFELPPLPPGSHSITITVYDPQGANATTVATFEVDQDADGDGFSPDTDCDDEVASTNPAAEETCNGIDDDCVEGIDNDVPQTVWFPDLDMDGYGDPTFPVSTCEDLSLEGYVEDYTDCNDRVASTHPGAVEECNSIDDDCLNGVDDGLDFQSWYVDLDHDGYGNPTSGISSCDDLSNSRVLDGTDCSDVSAILNHDDVDGDTIDSCSGDCNDLNGDVFPGQIEECDDVDQNCFGGIDEGFVKEDWWIDADGDSYGNPLTYLSSCVDHDATYIHEGTDCDDTTATLNQFDNDGDGQTSCLGDCADKDPKVFLGQFEACNGIDDNCKQGIDEVITFVNWFVDDDEDGAGDPTQFVKDCADLSATHSRFPDDCDDADPTMNTLDEDLDGVDTCAGDCDDEDPLVTFC